MFPQRSFRGGQSVGRRPTGRQATKDWRTGTSLAQRAASRHQFRRRLDAAGVCLAAAAVSQNKYFVQSFNEGRLKVIVPDYDTVAWVKINQASLLAQINAKLGSEVVTGIIIKIGQLPEF